MSDYANRLKAAVAHNAVVAVVGTGVSRAISKSHASADWVGLIKHGLERIVELDPTATRWRAQQDGVLDLAVEESDSNALIAVASQVKNRLVKLSPQTYADWLRDSVGSIKARDTNLATALASLRTPILTTNYDSLLEDSLHRPTETWRNIEGMREVFRSDTEAIGHLHGHWKDPASVVLSGEDYGGLLLAAPAQALEQAHYSSKQFLFIGYGAGLADPNFSRLLEWHRKLFPESRGDHFRLCSQAELATLTAYHAADDIRVISYGESHADLPPYLQNLRPDDRSKVIVARDAVAYAREALVEQLRTETIIGDGVADVDDRELAQLIVAPVFLPVPHEQFVNTRANSGGVRPERIDPALVVRGRKVLIVAGEELSGITTALKWVVSFAAEERARTAPLFVDARLCTISQRPLDRQVRVQALKHGLINGRKDPLPPLALAVDEVKPTTTREYDLLIQDILRFEGDFVAIGCREGDEGQLLEDLKTTPLDIEVVFLGKLGRSEVGKLARILTPHRSPSLVDDVMKVVRSERLPRTPFTIALLVVLLAKGAASDSINNSETTVLDNYVALLIGRSGPLLDPRQDLDPQNREVVLAQLAKYFVRERKGALDEVDVVKVISDYFESRDWSDSASNALNVFRARRLLRMQGTTVQFQQTSYLHLFAAKAAVRDEHFLAELLEDPLYFAPIIRHYAALVRDSEAVVRTVSNVLRGWNPDDFSGRFFGRIDLKAANALNEDEQAEEGEPEAQESEVGTPPLDDAELEQPVVEESPEEPYDVTSDADRVPFPLQNTLEWPERARVSVGLELASRVLRDSDDLADLRLKTEAFKLVVEKWGRLAALLEADQVFEELASEISQAFVDQGLAGPEERQGFAERLGLSLVGFAVYRGILSTLTSRKLLKTFERVREDEALRRDKFAALSMSIFAITTRGPGWSAELERDMALHGDLWSTSFFVAALARYDWEYSELTQQDASIVRQFLKDAYARKYKWPDERTRKIRLKNYEQRLLRERADGLARQRKQNAQKSIGR